MRAGTRRSTAIAASFSRTIADHGPDAVAFYVSGQFLTEDYYVANKLMKGFIGSGNIDTNSRLCMASSVAGHVRAFGEDIVPGCYEDIEAADLVVLVGSNTAWCHPVLYQRLVAAREKRGTKVVAIDPRHTATCDIADIHLAIRPGPMWRCSAVSLFILSRNGGCDQAWTRERTTGFAAGSRGRPQIRLFGRGCRADCRRAGSRSGPLLRPVRRNRARADILFARANQSSSGTDKVNAIINCHLATGRIGRPGMGPFSLTGQPNAMGGREVGGLANQLAAHMSFNDPGTSIACAGSGRRRGWRRGRDSRPSNCSTPCSTARSRRCGFSIPIRPSACRAPGGCARRWARVRSSSSAIAGRPTRRALPTSSCRRRRGARRTAPSPIRNAAFRGSAPFVRRRAKRGPIGG